jgi:glutathione S-transferase
LDYIEAVDARNKPGLRLVLSHRVPNLLCECAKAIFNVKKLPFVAVSQHVMAPNEELQDWTGYLNAPLAVWNDETARGRWYEILLLAERLQPEPRLVPVDRAQRAVVMGLSNEIMGEDGYAWNWRLMMFADQAAGRRDPDSEWSRILRTSYGGSEVAVGQAREKVGAILRMLSERLKSQRDIGSRYMVGTQLTAVDIYWTMLSVGLYEVSPSVCAAPPFANEIWAGLRAQLIDDMDPVLLQHRDFIWSTYLPENLDF